VFKVKVNHGWGQDIFKNFSTQLAVVNSVHSTMCRLA
jgi:hypothetical protein